MKVLKLALQSLSRTVENWPLLHEIEVSLGLARAERSSWGVNKHHPKMADGRNGYDCS